jgi:PAS domain S-box-containing protein
MHTFYRHKPSLNAPYRQLTLESDPKGWQVRLIEGEKAGREFARDMSIMPVKTVGEGIEVYTKMFQRLEKEGWKPYLVGPSTLVATHSTANTYNKAGKHLIDEGWLRWFRVHRVVRLFKSVLMRRAVTVPCPKESTSIKRPYVPPRLADIDLETASLAVRRVAEELRTERFRHHVAPQFTALVDNDRNYVRVSDSFCKLLGYAAEELIGKKYDYFTASNTTDIPTVFDMFKKLGYMHGLWVLVHRTGTHILVRYEAWLRPDACIEANMELVSYVR